MSILSHNLKNGQFLQLHEHLDQIRAATAAIRMRHSARVLAECAEAWTWLEDCIRLHDTGKGSEPFQQYIRNPDGYLRNNRPDTKSHTPLSTVIVLALARLEAWDWRRAFAVAQIARGHHSGLETRDNLCCGLNAVGSVLEVQVPSVDWLALGTEVGWCLRPLLGRTAEDLLDEGTDYLDDLFTQVVKAGDVRFRLRCQLVFSVLLEADKAFLAIKTLDLPCYLAPRQAALPPRLVETFIAGKPMAAINPMRDEARRAMFAGMQAAGGRRIHTMTLPTGTGKTLLATSWALTLRQRIAQEDGQPPLVLIVLPFLAIIDQTAREYEKLFRGHVDPGEIISYHSLSDRTYAPDLEADSQDFFLDTWQSDVVITTFDQFLFALLSPKARHQMRFHHLADAVIVLDEVQALPCILWDPLRQALEDLTQLGTTHVLAMSATQPGFLVGPHELIATPETFFRRMKRYLIVLRHEQPMNLEDFCRECKERLGGWERQRVLLTLNTRRSARSVRDEMEKSLPAGLPLEFLSADVTPGDRLAAIGRIKDRVKNGEACLVVSTQCIEAGVDIDMDLVIRDFGPLDSIIQVAGRCNRRGSPGRGQVEIVSLKDDESERLFAGMIYDPILLAATREVLAGLPRVNEEGVFPLAQEYFRRLSQQKDQGEEVTAAWGKWEEIAAARHLLRGKHPRQVAFVVIQNDPGLQADLETVGQIADRWKRRAGMRRLARRIAENTVTRFAHPDLDPASYADPYPPGKTEPWFWLLREGYYTAQRGLDFASGAADGGASWGEII